MPSKNQKIYFLVLLAYLNSVNILFVLARLFGVASIRAIILYDYFLIALLIAFKIPSVIIWICFVFIFTLDILAQVSSTFFFDVHEFIKNLQFSFLYNFSLKDYAILGLVIIFIFLNYIIIKKLNDSVEIRRGKLIALFAILFLFIYSLDFANGNSIINKTSKRIVSISKFNIGESSIRNVFVMINHLTRSAAKPEKFYSSTTFKTFENDSSNNQLLIILESFGLPRSSLDWEKFKDHITAESTINGWKSVIGSTPFSGSTTAAELRELLSVKGDYRYLLNKDSAYLFPSIFNLKKRQGYHTVAAHSFSAQMFERSIWWKNIGADSVIFMENVIDRKELTNDHLNYSTPFISLNDEDAFEALNGIADSTKKIFAYFLTENTHLPFHSKNTIPVNNKIIDFKDQLSDEANQQIIKIQEQLLFFLGTINKDTWPEVLIIGDHMPPFVKESDRLFYSESSVPYIILSKRNF
jgi:hypothetical protein